MMDKPITHPSNVLPRNLWVLLCQLGRQIFYRLANDFQIPDDCILRFAIFQEVRFTGLGIFPNCLYCVPDMRCLDLFIKTSEKGLTE